MMRSILMILAVLAVSSTAFANDIYIQQVGDTLDLDIVQDGTDNEFGDSTTDATLTGDDMTFSITQTGSTNKIDAIIKGNDYTGTWVFTGDSNEVNMKCASVSAVDCETVTVNITTTGDDNKFKVFIGENSDADNLAANFTVTGDGNVVDVNNDATASDVTITLNNEVYQFGNQGPVVVEQTNEEREAKEPKTYLGNIKVLWTDGNNVDRAPMGEPQQAAPAPAANDDLPF